MGLGRLFDMLLGTEDSSRDSKAPAKDAAKPAAKGASKGVAARPPPRGSSTFLAPLRFVQNLTGARKSLTPEQALEAQSRSFFHRLKAHAKDFVRKHHPQLGLERIEALWRLPSQVAPKALERLLEPFPQASLTQLQKLDRQLASAPRELLEAIGSARPDALDAPEFQEWLKRLNRRATIVEITSGIGDDVLVGYAQLPRVPAQAQVEALVRKWSDVDPEQLKRMAVAVAALTGEELGELLGAKWPRPASG